MTPARPPEARGPATAPRVLVRAPNHLGDACMTLPALRRLQAAGCAPTIAGRAWAAALFAGTGWQAIALPSTRRERWRALRAARACIDRGLLTTNSFSTALDFRAAGIPTAGYRTDARGWLLRDPIEVPDGWRGPMHTVVYYDELVRRTLQRWGLPAGDAATDTELRLPLSPDAMPRARQRLADAGVDGDYCVLCPVAVGRHHGQVKAWAGFPALCAALIARGLRVVGCPGPGEHDAVVAALPGAAVLPTADVASFAAVLAGSRVVVANDSGPGHLAAAVGAQLVSVFGVTEPWKTQPWGSGVTRVGDERGWPPESEVLDAVERALAR